MADKNPLSDKELNQLREVHVPINIKGLLTAWNYVTYKKPFDLYQGAARKVEGLSKRMMTGKFAAISFPVGIILRNTSRAAYNTSDDRYLRVGVAAGVLAAAGAIAAATVVAGPVIAGAVGLGALGTVIGYGAAAAASGLVLHRPVYTAGNLAASTIAGAGAAVFSTLISAPANLLVGIRRTQASLKGVKLTDEQIAAQEAAFNRKSPSARYVIEQESQVYNGLRQLPTEKKEEVYLSLKAEFEPAAAAKAETKTATPAAKTPTPKGPAA